MTLILQMIKKTAKSFGFAFQGVVYTFKTQWNFRIHVLASILTISLSFYLNISKLEWVTILLCIALVLFAELLNTAIESVVDLISPEYHKLAKIAKDTAAASVLVLAISSFVIGLIIFTPYLFSQ